MSFPLLFAWIPFSYVPIPSSGLLKNCFANLQFTCQIALVERLLWLSEEITVLIRELVRTAGTEQSTCLLRLCACNIQCASFGMSPQAGPPPGQGSHLLSLGNVKFKSKQLSDAGNVPPAVPDCALLQSRRCPLSPRARGKHRQCCTVRLHSWLLQPAFHAQ